MVLGKGWLKRFEKLKLFILTFLLKKSQITDKPARQRFSIPDIDVTKLPDVSDNFEQVMMGWNEHDFPIYNLLLNYLILQSYIKLHKMKYTSFNLRLWIISWKKLKRKFLWLLFSYSVETLIILVEWGKPPPLVIKSARVDSNQKLLPNWWN